MFRTISIRLFTNRRKKISENWKTSLDTFWSQDFKDSKIMPKQIQHAESESAQKIRSIALLPHPHHKFSCFLSVNRTPSGTECGRRAWVWFHDVHGKKICWLRISTKNQVDFIIGSSASSVFVCWLTKIRWERKTARLSLTRFWNQKIMEYLKVSIVRMRPGTESPQKIRSISKLDCLHHRFSFVY